MKKDTNVRYIEETFNVYIIHSTRHYAGESIAAAKTADEANKYIDEFKESDERNDFDSNGYECVTEDDLIHGVFADELGIIRKEIYYRG